ncbi:MAG TPA: site-2 protease family protein [Gemmatimonadaceae bacterium]
MSDIIDPLVYFVVFLLSTTLHEAAHAWAAKRGGDLTAYHGGQVSLDPLPHIRREPFGMVLLPLITALVTGWPLGFASAPYDPDWARRYPNRAALMALAGPAANLLLVVLAALLLRAGAAAGVLYAPDSVRFGHVAGTSAGGWWPGVAAMLSAFFSVNLLLGAFNLLPLPPLDGSGALPLFMRPKTSEMYQTFLWSNRALGWIGILIAWKVFDVIFDPIFTGAVNLLYPGVSYH